MIGRLTGLAADAARRSLGGFLPGLGVAAAAALLVAVSLGFATFAAYSYLRGTQGDVAAALIICAVYGSAAAAIWAVWSARRRRLPPPDSVGDGTATTPAGAADSVLLLLTAVGGKQNREVFDMAVRLGREMSPMQLALLSLIGGFIIGRKREK